jgi:hypothetical protein
MAPLNVLFFKKSPPLIRYNNIYLLLDLFLLTTVKKSSITGIYSCIVKILQATKLFWIAVFNLIFFVKSEGI